MTEPALSKLEWMAGQALAGMAASFVTSEGATLLGKVAVLKGLSPAATVGSLCADLARATLAALEDSPHA